LARANPHGFQRRVVDFAAIVIAHTIIRAHICMEVYLLTAVLVGYSPPYPCDRSF
jgi:hypothetical protein